MSGVMKLHKPLSCAIFTVPDIKYNLEELIVLCKYSTIQVSEFEHINFAKSLTVLYLIL